MTRRRLAIATGAALLVAGTFGASSATADPVAPSPVPSTGITTAGSDYIACAGLETIDFATCVESPIGPIFDLLPVQ